MAVIAAGTMFPPEVVKTVFSKVKGHSSLARVSGQVPVAFSGTDIFTFGLDGEVSIVGEGENKPAGDGSLEPVTIRPIKVVYQARVSDEFLRCSEEKALDILEAFSDGFSKKIARGLDIMAMHGVNPADLQASSAIGTNHLDTVTKVVEVSGAPESALADAVAAIGDYDATGFIFSKGFATELGNYKENGVSVYPEFKLGRNPGNFGGTPADVNSTVTKGNADDLAFVGDFASSFKWGYAENVNMKVIQYGDPDGQGDLQRKNQVVIRSEAFIGWGILDPDAFARIATK